MFKRQMPLSSWSDQAKKKPVRPSKIAPAQHQTDRSGNIYSIIMTIDGYFLCHTNKNLTQKLPKCRADRCLNRSYYCYSSFHFEIPPTALVNFHLPSIFRRNHNDSQPLLILAFFVVSFQACSILDIATA
jgi:hypothetical protein